MYMGHHVESRSRFPEGHATTNQTPLLIKLDSFKLQHPQFPVAMGNPRTTLQTRFILLSTEPSNRSIRGYDSVARDERSERVIRESGAD